MSGYTAFARFYDDLTRNVDYGKAAEYFAALLAAHGKPGAEILLDLACGTGSLSVELARMGYEVIGVDSSPDMLSRAAAKSGGGNPLFLCQDMRALDLYGTVDACVCALDSLNHLPSKGALQKTMASVSLFLAPGGVFAFDLNTPYKHREILGENAFVYETDQVFCVWRNHLLEPEGSVEIALDFFAEEENGGYRRLTEGFTERLFSHREVLEAIEKAGLSFIGLYDGDDYQSPTPPGEKTQRVVYLTRKPL